MNIKNETNPYSNIDLTAFWAEAVKAKSILAWIVEHTVDIFDNYGQNTLEGVQNFAIKLNH